ncbi:hypothetical protein GGR92_004820 [Spirosoma lacussanchae]
MPVVRPSQPDDETFTRDPDRMFCYAGPVLRRNYRRSWTGSDYRLLCGRFKGQLLSTVTTSKWLVWALNHFDDRLTSPLRRALIDQINSLHT